jgi:hypothetical protein
MTFYSQKEYIMLLAAETRSKGLSRTLVQRIHGTVMIGLGLSLAIATTYSEKTGTGIYPFLQSNPIVQVGLIQAYLLMAVLGIGVCFAAMAGDNHWKWDLLAALAHVPPLIAVFLYWNILASIPGQANTPYISLAIHSFWISIELLTIFLLKPHQNQ